MKSKVTAIIQARMRSSRLPGKVFLPLAGKPVLWWMATRASLAELVDDVVIATTTDESNDIIWLYGNQNYDKFPATVYRYSGKEDDVMGRVLAAAKYMQTDIIVDLTADCPMMDPSHIDYLIDNLSNADYISNDIVNRSWPDGLDIQVYKTNALKKCKKLFKPKQHCGWNIPQHPVEFHCLNWKAPDDMHWPELGLTLDTARDYEFLSKLFERFGHNPIFKVEDVIKYLRNNPKLITNKNVYRKTPEEG